MIWSPQRRSKTCVISSYLWPPWVPHDIWAFHHGIKHMDLARSWDTLQEDPEEGGVEAANRQCKLQNVCSFPSAIHIAYEYLSWGPLYQEREFWELYWSFATCTHYKTFSHIFQLIVDDSFDLHSYFVSYKQSTLIKTRDLRNSLLFFYKGLDCVTEFLIISCLYHAT